MKEHAVSPVLLNHKAGALVSLIETVTMLQICLCSTFWTQHKAYAASRFKIIRTFEKTSMLKAAINQYEERYAEREVKVVKDTQWYVRFVTTLRTTLPTSTSSPTTAASSHDETPAESAGASNATPARGPDGRFVQRPRSLRPNVGTRYVRCALVLHEFCVVALSKHTHVTGMTQGFQNCAQIRFMIRNESLRYE